MIPVIGNAGPITAPLEGDTSLENTEMSSLTYRMDWDKKRITSRLDGLEAVQQAVAKMLRTDRYEHLIYSSDYGTEWGLVLGKDRLLVRAEIRRIVSEALLQDERIIGLEDTEVSFNGDNLSFNCKVITQYGNFELRKEMSEGV
ncbi:hypothetical protein AMQ84_04180 [Paenibacillus riograndensis]|uniref:Phage portal protein n=1 Tax=Paenibacillus riograndensis TaxID=483937 RepID=A0A132U9V9_9BACL|nr:DUF2634 domain-containing protein [Paenibacillus riograndensis]KWX80318.1 hypothetical protein AMQ84_04180 [Paenibacillus riograndensis]KWX87052.1 hypothetical protein AMQ83_15415 [Paenibacillus riograndensis]